MKYDEDFEMWTYYSIHAFCINTMKVGDKYQMYETFEHDISRFDDAEEAQEKFQYWLEHGYDDFDGICMEQYWCEEENGDWTDCETIEREIREDAPQESKDLYEWGINEETGKSLKPVKKKKIIKK